MGTIKEIKNRVKGVEKIERVASAMEIVAATRLRRREKEVLSFRPYAVGIRQLFLNVAKRSKQIHPLMAPKQSQYVGILAVTSDRGLCGAFNENIFGAVMAYIKEKRGCKVIVIGKKGERFFRKRGVDIAEKFLDISPKDLNQKVDELTKKIVEMFSNSLVSRFVVFFNQFRLHLLGRAAQFTLLPALVTDDKKESVVVDYIYEPEPFYILEKLIPDYIFSQIKSVILESWAAEEMARMVAMKYATENAQDLIEELMLEYHKARQAQITKEIIEVVSGSGSG